MKLLGQTRTIGALSSLIAPRRIPPNFTLYRNIHILAAVGPTAPMRHVIQDQQTNTALAALYIVQNNIDAKATNGRFRYSRSGEVPYKSVTSFAERKQLVQNYTQTSLKEINAQLHEDGFTENQTLVFIKVHPCVLLPQLPDKPKTQDPIVLYPGHVVAGVAKLSGAGSLVVEGESLISKFSNAQQPRKPFERAEHVITQIVTSSERHAKIRSFGVKEYLFCIDINALKLSLETLLYRAKEMKVVGEPYELHTSACSQAVIELMTGKLSWPNNTGIGASKGITPQSVLSVVLFGGRYGDRGQILIPSILQSKYADTNIKTQLQTLLYFSGLNTPAYTLGAAHVKKDQHLKDVQNVVAPTKTF